MTYTGEELTTVLDVLTDQCIVGRLHIRMARRISSALEDPEAIQSFYYPLVVALDAFDNTSLLHLIRPFDRGTASLLFTSCFALPRLMFNSSQGFQLTLSSRLSR
jgi:hypothetical protein